MTASRVVQRRELVLHVLAVKPGRAISLTDSCASLSLSLSLSLGMRGVKCYGLSISRTLYSLSTDGGCWSFSLSLSLSLFWPAIVAQCSSSPADINLEFAPPRTGTVPDSAPALAAPPAPAAKARSPFQSTEMRIVALSCLTPVSQTPAAPAAAPLGKGTATGTLATTAEQVEGKDFKSCDNCKRKASLLLLLLCASSA